MNQMMLCMVGMRIDASFGSIPAARVTWENVSHKNLT